MANANSILIAGVGNIFFGDDAFGCFLARRLSQKKWPPGVVVRDFGIRSLDLAFALMEPCDHVILLDAVKRREAPGTLYLIQPDRGADGLGSSTTRPVSPFDSHSLDSEKVLQLAESWGAKPLDILLIGCEPGVCPESEEDSQAGLSEPVGTAVEIAARMTEMLVKHYVAGGRLENFAFGRVGEAVNY